MRYVLLGVLLIGMFCFYNSESSAKSADLPVIDEFDLATEPVSDKLIKQDVFLLASFLNPLNHLKSSKVRLYNSLKVDSKNMGQDITWKKMFSQASNQKTCPSGISLVNLNHEQKDLSPINNLPFNNRSDSVFFDAGHPRSLGHCSGYTAAISNLQTGGVFIENGTFEFQNETKRIQRIPDVRFYQKILRDIIIKDKARIIPGFSSISNLYEDPKFGEALKVYTAKLVAHKWSKINSMHDWVTVFKKKNTPQENVKLVKELKAFIDRGEIPSLTIHTELTGLETELSDEKYNRLKEIIRSESPYARESFVRMLHDVLEFRNAYYFQAKMKDKDLATNFSQYLSHPDWSLVRDLVLSEEIFLENWLKRKKGIHVVPVYKWRSFGDFTGFQYNEISAKFYEDEQVTPFPSYFLFSNDGRSIYNCNGILPKEIARDEALEVDVSSVLNGTSIPSYSGAELRYFNFVKNKLGCTIISNSGMEVTPSYKSRAFQIAKSLADLCQRMLDQNVRFF